MEKTLWVKGCNGLGNRLLVLEKTLRLAAKYSSAVYIDWTDDVFSLSSSTFRKYFNLIQTNEVERPNYSNYRAPYPKHRALFETSNVFEIGTFRPFLHFIPDSIGIWRRVSRLKHRFRLHNKCRTLCFNADAIESKIADNSNDLICIVSEIPLHEPEIFRHIQLNGAEIKSLSKKYNVASQDFDIAIHVRDTDKASPQRKSLHKILNHLVSPGEVLTVYLATDNQKIIQELTEKFGRSFQFSFPEFERNGRPLHLNQDTEGKEVAFESAIVDLYHLATAKTILFQENSSFSRVAISLSSPNTKRITWSTL